jgi:membrane-bound lytic murein transglycosylase B
MLFTWRSCFITLLCTLFSLAPYSVALADSSDQQAALQAQLDQLNAEIAQNQGQLAVKQKERTSLERDVSVLDYKIKEALLEIKQRDLTIKKIKASSAQKQVGILSLDSQLSVGEQSVAQMLREINEIDNTSLPSRILGGSLLQYFRDIDDFARIQQDLNVAFTKMAAEKQDLAARKAALDEEQQEQRQLLSLQVAQNNSLKTTEQQKKDLVSAAKGQEAVYASTIATKQKTAAQIESALFALNNANHSTSFGDMYTYAKEAAITTGVDPAFILAILTEESDLGKNVGNCNYQNAMNPKRDIPVYLQIMQSLGLSPDSEKVSCAQSYGAYGGAMGPAQFIPATWSLYANRIASASGQNPANPWDPRTATFATALYMKDLGADARTASSERQAALRYLAGSHWQNPAYAFYWESVQGYMQQYQQDISVVNGS